MNYLKFFLIFGFLAPVFFSFSFAFLYHREKKLRKKLEEEIENNKLFPEKKKLSYSLGIVDLKNSPVFSGKNL